jgi:hypothetical protein
MAGPLGIACWPLTSQNSADLFVNQYIYEFSLENDPNTELGQAWNWFCLFPDELLSGLIS